MPESLEDVQDAILDRLHAGEPIDRDATLAAHPGHGEALREFFRVLDVIETSPPPDAAAPASLGEFRIIRELGKGGMGIVYEAEQASLKRRVALKVLPPALRADPRLVVRFRREAEAAGKLRHPGIVPVYSVGDVAGTPFFAMEMVEGRSLDAILRDLREGSDAGLPPAGEERRRWAVETIAKVADALDYAHGRGILHRDVKPGNILLDRDGAPRLTDFGLALDAAAPGLTMAGEVFGSLHYMSPEQAARRESPVDARTDVYSLAVTLFELLTLRLPYDGDTSAELLTALTTGRLARLADVDPSIPPALDAVVMHALRRDPAARCASAAAFASDLRAALAGQPVAAAAPPPATTRPRRIRLSFAVPTGLAVAAGLIVAAVVWGFGYGRSQSSTSQALGNDDLQRLADGDAGSEEFLAKALRFDVQSRPLIVRRHLSGFQGRVSWRSLSQGRLREPLVAFVMWDVSVDGGRWSHAHRDWSMMGFSPPADPTHAEDDPDLLSATATMSTRISVLLGPALAHPSVAIRYRATFRVVSKADVERQQRARSEEIIDTLTAPTPAELAGAPPSLTSGTAYTWTSEEKTYLIYDDYPADFPSEVGGADVAAAMTRAVTPEKAEFAGLSTGTSGDARALPLLVRWTGPEGPLAAACEVDLMVPGRDGVLGTTSWIREASDDAPTKGGTVTSWSLHGTLVFRLPAAPTPDEAKLVLDLESGAQASLRLVFRPSRSVARKDPNISRYWGGTVDVTIPVTRGTGVVEVHK